MTRTMTMGTAGALALATMTTWTPDARAEDLPAEAPRSPPELAIGEAGDVVLEDVVGGRSGSVTTTAGVMPGAAVGGVGGAAFITTGPSFSAAWLGISSTNTEVNGLSTAMTRWSFHPSVDVFPARGVSIGARLGIERATIRVPLQTATIDSSVASLDPRVGYIISVTPEAAVWPRMKAGITLHRQSFSSSPPTEYRIGADVPLVLRVSKHVVVDFGPELTYSVLDTNRGPVSRTLGLAARGGLSLVF